MPSDYYVLTMVLGGAAGYYIRYRLSRDGADRKEDRDKLNAVADNIEKVEDLAYQYYSLPFDADEAKKLSLQINRLMKKIGNDVYQLSVIFEDAHITKLQLAFKQIVTLNDYESSSRMPRGSGDPLFCEISDASRKLIGGLELAFRRKYRNHNNKNITGLSQK